MSLYASLSEAERDEVEASCELVCERLETEDVYQYHLGVLRGKPGSFAGHVWDEALRRLGVVGYVTSRTDSMITMRKKS